MTLGSRLKLLIEEVKDLISGQRQKEKETSPVKPPAKKGKSTSTCLHHFGYLGSRPENAPIPQQCLTCQKILECMHGENKSAFPNQKPISTTPDRSHAVQYSTLKVKELIEKGEIRF